MSFRDHGSFGHAAIELGRAGKLKQIHGGRT
jgi:hypothetical protein